ncbi:sarcosine oxidase [Rhizobium jaguaris]|uniref:Sarcosine oxidase n=1 Tax=Rhizobium jaguaris TaxID=1312183 RepID=A0A387FYM2_9HYPH|nr:sarcosine oxidase [Rhizobium jaguaris]AYG64160.1 sarcosine oxidase [Rhizobium jaguaris]
MGAVAKSPFGHRFDQAAPVRNDKGVIIRDFSRLGRTGFKGAGTTEWLTTKVRILPDRPNRAVASADSALIARLGKEEYLILDQKVAGREFCSDLEAAWNADSAQGATRIGYPLPRADSHSWLYLEGNSVAQMMSKICGVDLRDGKFEPGEVAQTVVARIGAVLIRQMDKGSYGIHMLTDFASADYLWDVLEDACAEFGGGFAGTGRT